MTIYANAVVRIVASVAAVIVVDFILSKTITC
jgi:hypothetical protein